MLTTAIQARGALIAVMDRAVNHDALRDNPVRKTIAPAKRRPEPTAMTAFDVARLRRATSAWHAVQEGRPGPRPTGHLPVVVDVMLGTGLRIGEVMALRWGEVNLSPDGLPTIAVTATMVDIKGRGTVRQERPKIDAGQRSMIVPRFTAEALESIRPEVTSADMPVFPSRDVPRRPQRLQGADAGEPAAVVAGGAGGRSAVRCVPAPSAQDDGDGRSHAGWASPRPQPCWVTGSAQG